MSFFICFAFADTLTQYFCEVFAKSQNEAKKLHNTYNSIIRENFPQFLQVFKISINYSLLNSLFFELNNILFIQ
jgi:hypothetical protein